MYKRKGKMKTLSEEIDTAVGLDQSGKQKEAIEKLLDCVKNIDFTEYSIDVDIRSFLPNRDDCDRDKLFRILHLLSYISFYVPEYKSLGHYLTDYLANCPDHPFQEHCRGNLQYYMQDQKHYKAIILIIASPGEDYNKMKEIQMKYMKGDERFRAFFIYGDVDRAALLPPQKKEIFIPEKRDGPSLFVEEGETKREVPSLFVEEVSPEENIKEEEEGHQNVQEDLFFPRIKESLVPGILEKTIAALRHIDSNFSFDYVWRTNLSSFLALDRFANALDKLPKTGLYMGKNYPHYPYTFCSGAGFLMSRDVARYLYTNQRYLQRWLPDDVAMGALIQNQYKVGNPADTGIAWTYDIDHQNPIKLDENSKIGDHFHFRLKTNNAAAGIGRDMDLANMRFLSKYFYE